jgi:hypothetical protein
MKDSPYFHPGAIYHEKNKNTKKKAHSGRKQAAS